MNLTDKNEIVARYRERLTRHGQDIKALASGTPERREIRFGILAGVGNLEGCSILDLGCGFGDFYQYLREKDVHVNYTGYDICPDFVELASRQFPEAKFEVRDVQTQGIAERLDYIISSQTFNNRLQH